MAKKSDADIKVITMGQLWTALEARYPKREYAFLQQVRNGTGYDRQARTADAIALSLWPSRGLTLSGFEVKQYRGDWKREKDAPEKAEEIAQYCDFWWLVVTDARIAPLDEVPDTWGVLAPNKDGSGLAVSRQAAKLNAKPMSKSFMAAILRNASDSMCAAAAVNGRIEEAHRKGIEEGQDRSMQGRELDRLRALEARVLAFEASSGVQVCNTWAYGETDPARLGAALKALIGNDTDLKWKIQAIERLEKDTKELAKLCANQVGLVRQAAKQFRIAVGVQDDDAA